ncbi:MAG: PorV/PorQ family protein [Elusimicrobia bacterium]|nr:PorV/PorQ family protein [Elusimicrobiota bacterium]
MKRALALCLALVSPGFAASDFSQGAIGTSGSEFLLFDVGARGIGMGGAFTAVSQDATSLYWNPAGLARVPKFSAAFTYNRLVADMSYQAAAAAQRISDGSVLAAGLRHRDAGDITRTDLAGNDRGSFRPRDYILDLGWGQGIFDLSDNDMDVLMGVAARWIHSDYGETADALAGDIGVIARFYTGLLPYDVGFSAQNMGRGQKFDKARDHLPFRARFGGAIYPLNGMTVSGDIVTPINNQAHFAVGGEYGLAFDRNIEGFARLGFNSLTLESLGTASAISAGVGLRVADFAFDYAFSPAGPLGAGLHRLSIGYNLPAKTSQRYKER